MDTNSASYIRNHSKGKICMILGHNYPEVRLSREAETLVMNGYDVTVVAYIRNDDINIKDEVINGVNVIRIKSKIDKNSSFFKRILQFYRATKVITDEIKKLSPDIIHCNDLEMMWVGLKVKKLLNKPLIYDRRENWPDMMWVTSKKRGISLKIQVFLARIFEKIALQKSDYIIVVVDEAKEKISKMGIDEKKITVIMNTEKPENYSNDKIDEHLKNELESKFYGKVVITYVGWFGPHRGLENAIVSMKYVIKEVPNSILLLVGHGNNYDDLNKLRDSLGLKNNIIFTGKVPSEKIPTYISISDIGIIPHLSNPHTEATIPNKLFQYMLLSKPVVCSNLKPLSRIVNETKCGLVYPSNDPHALAEAIIKLAKDENLRIHYGKNGYTAALNKYNWHIDEKRLINLYNEVSGTI